VISRKQAKELVGDVQRLKGYSQPTKDDRFTTGYIRNRTGEDLTVPFSVLGVGDSELTDEDCGGSVFRSRTYVRGETPALETYWRKFAIVIDPLEEDEAGQAIMRGESPVKIKLDDEDHQYANVEDDETGYLRSASRGIARIIWRSTETDDDGNYWAVIRFPEADEGLIVGENTTAETIPNAAFAEVDAMAGTAQDPIAQVKKPTADSIDAPQLLVATRSVATGKYDVFTKTTSGAVHIYTSGTVPTTGDSFGSVSGQWYGEKDKTGFKALGALGGRAVVDPFSDGFFAATASGSGIIVGTTTLGKNERLFTDWIEFDNEVVLPTSKDVLWVAAQNDAESRIVNGYPKVAAETTGAFEVGVELGSSTGYSYSVQIANYEFLGEYKYERQFQYILGRIGSIIRADDLPVDGRIGKLRFWLNAPYGSDFLTVAQIRVPRGGASGYDLVLRFVPL